MKRKIIILICIIIITIVSSILLFNIYKDKYNHSEISKNDEIITNNQIDKEISNEKENLIEKDNTNNTNEQPRKWQESEIVNYFEELNFELDTQTNLSQKIKEKFVNCIDFIFYDKEIGGKTFKELTNDAKLKILEITLSIDSKIDNKFPNYKDTINEKYQNIKSKIIERYLEITANICNNNQETCNKAKEGFKNLKESFGITWDLIKEFIGTNTNKLKDWYEIWKYK